VEKSSPRIRAVFCNCQKTAQRKQPYNSHKIAQSGHPTRDVKQCDQIGRIFANQVIVYFGQFLKIIYIRSPKFLGNVFPRKGYLLISTKRGWATFWEFFRKHVWSP
jgi:hypothetical protein